MVKQNNDVAPVPLESQIQRTICDYLDLMGFFFWRSNNVPVFAKNNGGKMVYRKLPKYTPKGLPDIIIVHKGVFVGIEVKRPKRSNITADQVAFKYGCERAGGLYFIVHSLEEFMDINFLRPPVKRQDEYEKRHEKE